MSSRVKVFGWISLGVGILAVLVMTGLYIRSVDNTPKPVEQQAATDQLEQELVDALEQAIEENDIENTPEPGEGTATLDSVRDNGNEFAVATRTFDAPANEFTIEFVGTLGAPQPGNEYITFITDGPTSLRLGELIFEVENTFSLTYKSNQDISKLNEIVVIESGATEEDVLQGFFE